MHARLVVIFALRIVLPGGIHSERRNTQSKKRKSKEEYPSKNPGS